MRNRLTNWLIFLGLVVIHFFLLNKITLTAWPEMFSYPYLVNKGFLIYRDFAHPYEPLLTFILAFVYSIFGYGLITYKIIIYFFILIVDLLIFLLSKKLIKNQKIIFIPLFFYLLLQPVFDGNMLWFDLGTTPFIVLGIFSLFLFQSNIKSFFLLGFFLGISFFIKQQTILLSAATLIYLLTVRNFKSTSAFLSGFLIPSSITLLTIFVLGVFKDFFFWTFLFPVKWLPKFPGYIQNPASLQVIILFFVFGPVIFLILKSFKNLNQKIKVAFLIFFASLAISFPRFSYFHLQPAIAIWGILIVFLLGQGKFKLIYLTPCLLVIIYMWIYYQPFTGIKQARFHDGSDLEVAKYVADNSKSTDRIYLLGPHSLIYVLSDRLPSKPWIDNYVWYFEIPGIQESFLDGFKKEKTILFKSPTLEGNWFDLGTYQPQKIIQYVKQNYHLSTSSKAGVEAWIKN